MNNYEVSVRIDSSYDLIVPITCKNEFEAIKGVREQIKRERSPRDIWFYNLRKINEG